MGMIAGWYESLQLAYECTGAKDVTVKQLIDMVVQELRDKPQLRNKPAWQIATNVFVRDFKCKKLAQPEGP
jgi:hypothetical protein